MTKTPSLEEALSKLDLKGTLVLLNLLSNQALVQLMNGDKVEKEPKTSVILPNRSLATATSNLLPININTGV